MYLVCNSCDGKYDSLDVRFTRACDNNCEFCIEKAGIAAHSLASAELMAKRTWQSGIDSILIVGGEPFLDINRLFQYVVRIRSFVKEIFITTSLPQSMKDNRGTLDAIIQLVDGVNVSIQSLDNDQNNQTLGASNAWDRIKFLKEVFLKKYPNKIRVNLNLIRGVLYTEMGVFHAVADLRDWGCQWVKLNELQNNDLAYVSYEEIARLDLPSPYSHGCQTDLQIPGITGIRVTLKRSCFVVESSRRATFSDLVKAILKRFYRRKNKFAVLYEDGTLSSGWKKCQQGGIHGK